MPELEQIEKRLEIIKGMSPREYVDSILEGILLIAREEDCTKDKVNSLAEAYKDISENTYGIPKKEKELYDGAVNNHQQKIADMNLAPLDQSFVTDEPSPDHVGFSTEVVERNANNTVNLEQQIKQSK